jgi:hypothetical protein
MGVIDCHGSFEYSSMQRDVVSKVSSTKAQAEGLTRQQMRLSFWRSPLVPFCHLAIRWASVHCLS